MKHVRRIFFFVLAFCLVSVTSQAEDSYFEGFVVGVSDGDTISVKRADDNSVVKVRLHGIDCPERGQDFGTRAREYTADMVFNRTVEVHIRQPSPDKYGRTVAEIIYADTRDGSRRNTTLLRPQDPPKGEPERKSLNLQLVKAGMAHWSRQYAPHDTRFRAAEEDAKAWEMGIWSLPKPVSPETYRRDQAEIRHERSLERQQQSLNAVPSSSVTSTSVGSDTSQSYSQPSMLVKSETKKHTETTSHGKSDDQKRFLVIEDKHGHQRVIESRKESTPKSVSGPFNTREEAQKAKEGKGKK